MDKNDIAQVEVDNVYGTTEDKISYLGKFYRISGIQFSHNGIWPVCHVYKDGTVCFSDAGDWVRGFKISSLGNPRTNQDLLDQLIRVQGINSESNFQLYLSSCHPYIQQLWRESCQS